jgi:hypothetical protein
LLYTSFRGNIHTTKGERKCRAMKTIRYIKEFKTKAEQEKLINHLKRIGIDFDYGIKIKNGISAYYVKAFN